MMLVHKPLESHLGSRLIGEWSECFDEFGIQIAVIFRTLWMPSHSYQSGKTKSGEENEKDERD
jgi:hypothetical protein